MEIRSLKYFLAVAESENITIAAQKLIWKRGKTLSKAAAVFLEEVKKELQALSL